jgi:preprotein translocase subunit SecF
MSMYYTPPKVDLVRIRGLWYLLSVIVAGAGLYALLSHGLNLGVDFTGGTVFQYQFQKPLGATRAQQTALLEQTRRALPVAGVEQTAGLQIVGNNILAVRMAVQPKDRETVKEKVKQALSTSLAAQYGPPEEIASQSIGAALGSETRRRAVWALALGCVLMIIYITVRYRFTFAITAVFALVHDCLIMAGAVAISRLEVDSSFVAALLTVVGYSINDTIVIYDRIRENLRLRRTGTFEEIVNVSLWQTMTRSIYTVLTVLFVLWAIFLFGGTTLHSFAFALLVGITSGAYSSIFNAPQLAVTIQRWRGGPVQVSRSFRVPTGVPGLQKNAASAPTSAASTAESSGEQPATAAAPSPRRDTKAKRRPSGGKRKRRF